MVEMLSTEDIKYGHCISGKNKMSEKVKMLSISTEDIKNENCTPGPKKCSIRERKNNMLSTGDCKNENASQKYTTLHLTKENDVFT